MKKELPEKIKVLEYGKSFPENYEVYFIELQKRFNQLIDYLKAKEEVKQ